MSNPHPQRIVCLTEETTEWLYLLGQEQRIVGISGYTVRPPRARQEKPRISSFLDGKINRIVALEPDLVIGFSDMQAALADKLIRAGLNVLVTNQRSVAQIFQTLRLVAGLVAFALITRPLRDTMAVCPPLIITEPQIDELFDKLGRALDHTLGFARDKKLVA
jgi:ABC-type hemin transport system substrate-binding protein